VVLHRGAKEEISLILAGASQDCHGPSAKIISWRDSTSDLRLPIPRCRFRTSVTQ
jgi:hypothetical protein